MTKTIPATSGAQRRTASMLAHSAVLQLDDRGHVGEDVLLVLPLDDAGGHRGAAPVDLRLHAGHRDRQPLQLRADPAALPVLTVTGSARGREDGLPAVLVAELYRA